MFIELSEALACPACGPPQGLVVVVDRLDGRRVLDGFLGCPICEARFPVRSGVVDLGADTRPGRPPRSRGGGDDASRAAATSDSEQTATSDSEQTATSDSEQTATLIAALFDVTDGRGYVLLDESLSAVASRVAELTGGCEVIALAAAGNSDAGEALPDTQALAAGTNIVTGCGESLPVQTGRLRALALREPTEARLTDAVRALGAEGRLVVLQPTAEVRAWLHELPVRVLADESVAFLGAVSPGA